MARKKVDRQTRKLFKSEQVDMFEKSYEEELEERRKQKVECLGMTFENDETRREHFLGILREKLKDPEFRKIEGFPIGEDEDKVSVCDRICQTNDWQSQECRVFFSPLEHL
jgi:hypothetical protein